MPRKTPIKKVHVSVHRSGEQKLIDEKLRKAAEAPGKMPKVAAIASVLGFIVGAGILAYFLLIEKPEVEPIPSPEIVLPQENIPSGSQPEEPSETPPATTTPVVVQQVVILDTPTGFLNVRTGAGTNFPKIAEAKPGDIFDLVSEDKAKGWFEIRLTATTTGWLTKQYAKIEQ